MDRRQGKKHWEWITFILLHSAPDSELTNCRLSKVLGARKDGSRRGHGRAAFRTDIQRGLAATVLREFC